jgi:hypothetical protein
MAIARSRTARGAAAGTLAAAVWAATQPLDKRVFGGGYDDVELLGRAAVAPFGGWRRTSRRRPGRGAPARGLARVRAHLRRRAMRAVVGRADDVPARVWYPVGLVLHLQNGALFGAVYANLAPRARWLPPSARGPAAGLTEHVGLWPLGRLSDRFHPARHALPPLRGNRRAFWQAVWRHLLFGVLLGELERRLNPPPRAAEPVDSAGTPE